MNYRIEKMPAFQVAAKTKRFDSDNAQKEIPGFWGNCREDGTMKALCAYLKGDGVFGSALLGICEEDASSPRSFPYSIGAEYNGAPLSEGFTIKEIPERTWAIFECTGPMPDAMQELWHRIYASYFPTSDYQPFGGIDFEVYPEGDLDGPNYKSEIWVAVKKK
jgi:AraC family transcriptional regulator